MQQRTRYTLAEIRRSYTPQHRWEEIEGDFPSFLIYRQLSFYVTPIFLWLRVSPTVATLFGGALAVSMAYVAWRGGEFAYLGVAALGFGVHLMDGVDGNIARTTGRTSSLGASLDCLVDRAYFCLLIVSMGFLVEHAGGGVLGDRALSLSLALTVLVLLHRVIRDDYHKRSREESYFSSEIPERVSAKDAFLIAIVGLENLYVFAIAIGGAFGVLDRVLLGVAVYVAIIFVGAILLTLQKAAADDAAANGPNP